MTSHPAAYPFGFVTIATGKSHYLEMAVDLALSLKRFHDDPMILLAHGVCFDVARRDYAGVFDQIIELPETCNGGRRAKFLLSEYTPVERGIFIDSDIMVLRPLDDLIKACGRKPAAMMGRFLSKDTERRHHGVRISKLCHLFDTEQFFTSHSACILFDRARSEAFFQEADLVFTELLRMKPGPFIGDELAFGIAAARHGMARMPEPFPVIWEKELQAFDFDAPSKPLLHCHTAPPDTIMEPALKMVADLRQAQGLDVGRSRRAWKRKLRANAKDPLAKARQLRRAMMRLFVRRGAQAEVRQ